MKIMIKICWLMNNYAAALLLAILCTHHAAASPLPDVWLCVDESGHKEYKSTGAVRGCKKVPRPLPDNQLDLDAGEAFLTTLESKKVVPHTMPDPNMNLSEARKRIPELSGLDDEQAINVIHQAYYPEMDKEEVAKKLGYVLPAQSNEKMGTHPALEVTTQKSAVSPAESTSGMSVDFGGALIAWILIIGGLFKYFKMRSAEKKILSTNQPHLNDLIGMGGWLSFFIFSLGVLSPLSNFGGAAGNFYRIETSYAVLENNSTWVIYKNIVWLVLTVFSTFNIYSALQLRFVWKPISVKIAKFAVASGPISSMLLVVATVTIPDPPLVVDIKVIGQFLASVIVAGIWVIYLSVSKRVKATYCINEIGTNALHAPGSTEIETKSVGIKPSVIGSHVTPSHVATKSEAKPFLSKESERQNTTVQIAVTVDENRIYAVIANELETDNQDKGLWTRLYAECSGDETKTKVRYINQRADQLISAERYRLDQAARERSEAEILEQTEQRNHLNIIIALKDKWQNSLSLSNEDFSLMVIGLVDYKNTTSKQWLKLDFEPIKIMRFRGSNTLLHDAVETGNIQLVEFLLKAGSSHFQKNRIGQSADQLTTDPEILRIFIKYNKETTADPDLVSAVWGGNWATASKLLISGVKPGGADENGNSLLDLARTRGDTQMIHLLDSYGAC